MLPERVKKRIIAEIINPDVTFGSWELLTLLAQFAAATARARTECQPTGGGWLPNVCWSRRVPVFAKMTVVLNVISGLIRQGQVWDRAILRNRLPSPGKAKAGENQLAVGWGFSPVIDMNFTSYVLHAIV